MGSYGRANYSSQAGLGDPTLLSCLRASSSSMGGAGIPPDPAFVTGLSFLVYRWKSKLSVLLGADLQQHLLIWPPPCGRLPRWGADDQGHQDGRGGEWQAPACGDWEAALPSRGEPLAGAASPRYGGWGDGEGRADPWDRLKEGLRHYVCVAGEVGGERCSQAVGRMEDWQFQLGGWLLLVPELSVQGPTTGFAFQPSSAV